MNNGDGIDKPSDAFEPIPEYKLHNFDAVDEQIKQMSVREREVTRRLVYANYLELAKVAAVMLIGLGFFILLIGIAIRIAYPERDHQIIPTSHTHSSEKHETRSDIVKHSIASGTELSLNNRQFYDSKRLMADLATLRSVNPEAAQRIDAALRESAAKMSLEQRAGISAPSASEESEGEKPQVSSIAGKNDVFLFASLPQTDNADFGGITTRIIFLSSLDEFENRRSCYVKTKESNEGTRHFEIGAQPDIRKDPIFTYTATNEILSVGLARNWFEEKCQWRETQASK